MADVTKNASGAGEVIESCEWGISGESTRDAMG